MEDTRRNVLAGGAAVAGAALAGCLGGGGDGGSSDRTYVKNEPSYAGWFNGVSNHRGTVELRGQDEVSVKVGVQNSNGYYSFGPTAVAVSPGTKVVWKWTGRGGSHNVVGNQGRFDSGNPVTDEGHTFEQTLADPGVYKYLCEPHKDLGMRGAVFVALGPPDE